MNHEQSHASLTPITQIKDPRLPHLADSHAFRHFMSEGWSAPDRTPPTVDGVASASYAHRAKLSSEYPHKTIVVCSGSAPARSNDDDYEFRPDSAFFWLTGCTAEDAVLVMSPAGSAHDSTLYVPEPYYPDEPGFFSNASRGELWVGSAPGPEHWSGALDITTRGITQLEAALRSIEHPLVGGGPSDVVLSTLGPERSTDLARTLSELRMFKDSWEIGQMRLAVNHTMTGFAAVAREMPTAIAGGGERWLQGTFYRHARTHGNGVGYTTIVGSGRNAATLHWTRCDGPVAADQLVLLDMGVEVKSFYTADVTRTLPASGTFSSVQRQVHDLVERAHRAAMEAVTPGNLFSEFTGAAMHVIAQGLRDWDILKVSVAEALSTNGQQHRRYLVCGIGHHLGLDVHDCAKSHYDRYQNAELAPGMVLTVEPGLYFHHNDLTVPPELRGIGVRLEDDLLITTNGHDVLSEGLPIDASGIENWCAEQAA